MKCNMTNEEMNNVVYEKLLAEFEAYEKELLSLAPEDILKHACEYTVKQDILMTLEYHNLTDRQQIQALLDSPHPLDDIFNTWEHTETDYMDRLFSSVKECADKNRKEKV